MKEFVVDRILNREDICNLKKTANTILVGVLAGKNQVFYGRRNTGKTSLIRNVVFPEYRKKHKDGIAIFADLIGVRSLDDISQRIMLGISQALVKKFPTQSKIKTIVKGLLNLQPKIALDPQTGEIGLILSSKATGTSALQEVFKEISYIHKKSGVVVAFDEFQDVALVEGAEAALRSCLQEVSKNLPVIVLGSKKHMLSQIFAAPGAPLANWGVDIEIPDIETAEYREYINERLLPHGITIGLDETLWLQKRMRFIPEAINMTCISLIDVKGAHTRVTHELLAVALQNLLDTRRSRFEEYLLHFSNAEVSFLRTLAHGEPIDKLTGVDFLRNSRLSSGGVIKIIKKLENAAVIYRGHEGYFLSDPVLA